MGIRNVVKDYYHVLGVSVEAETAEIKKAYRLLAKICHPDVRPGEDHPEAQEQFEEITEAYDVLVDPARRRKYDQMTRMRWKTPGESGRRAGAGRPASMEWTATSVDAEPEPAVEARAASEPTAKSAAKPRGRPGSAAAPKRGPKSRPKRAGRSKSGAKPVTRPKPKPEAKSEAKRSAEPAPEPAAAAKRASSSKPRPKRAPRAKPPRPQRWSDARSEQAARTRRVAAMERSSSPGPTRFDPPGARANGGGASADRRSRIVEVVLSFETAMKGGVQVTTVPMQEKCEKCGGTGSKSKRGITVCPGCEGRGYLAASGLPLTEAEKCPRCDGRGSLVRERCTRCQGSGWSRKDRKIGIRVEPGEEDGTRRPLSEVMEPMEGVEPGKIQVEFRVREHPFLRRRGLDIACEAPIDLGTAIQGGDVAVRTALGKRVVVKVPPGTDGGTTFRVPGEGVRKGGRTGNHLVTVKIVIPKDLSDKAREYLDLFLREIRR